MESEAGQHGDSKRFLFRYNKSHHQQLTWEPLGQH